MSNLKSVALTKDEALLLVQLVGANKMVTNKQTNATNNALKEKAWFQITEQFNSSISSCPRETRQLKLKWENLKKAARKRSANIRINQFKTGGGKADFIPPDEVLELVATILGATCEGYSVPFGDDAETFTPNTSGIEGTPPLTQKEGEETIIEGVVQIDGSVNMSGSATPKRKFIFGPSSRRAAKARKITDELAQSNIERNKAVANYYNLKSKMLEAEYEEQKLKIQKLELENDKLKKELEKH